ncbi:hypothetical protein Tco_1049062 [Tanacetum coccineum]
MLQICPKLPGQHFVDTPFEEDILAFMRELGYSGTIKLLSDVKCIRSKTRSLERTSTYTTQDSPRSSSTTSCHKINRFEEGTGGLCSDRWLFVDPILTTMRFIPQHEVVQKYGAILPDYLTTQAMKESEAYKTYHALFIGKVQPKPKYVRRSSRTKTDDVPKQAIAKVAKSRKKKQPTIGLDTLLDITLTKAEQLKLATKRSLTQTHISQPSSSGAHEGTIVKPGVLDVPTYHSDDEDEIPWKSSDEDDNDDNEDDDNDQGVLDDDHGDDNDSERTVSDIEGDDFVHPKFTSHDTEERHDEEDKNEQSFDSRVQTPSYYEPLDDEANDDLAQSRYAVEEEVNVEQTFEANINLEGRDAEMTDAPKTTQVIEDTHVTLTLVNPEGQQQSSSVSSSFISNMLNPNPDTGIDSVLNVETTSLVDVLVTSQATTTLPQPSNPLIPPVQQTPTPTPATTSCSLLLNLPNFGSLFRFDDRLKRLEADFSEFKQTNQYATALSSIPNIVDNYLGSKLKESVDVAVQLKSDRLREEAQIENESFLNKLDATMQKIIKEQVNTRLLSKDDEMRQMMIKNPPLEQTGGPREGMQEKNQNLPVHQKRRHLSQREFKIGVNDDQSEDEIHPHPDWFQKPTRLPSPDRDWNKTLPADHGPVQPWLSNLAREENPQESYDELMDTPLDFSVFVMNRLKATTEQLDWTNPDGQQYPHDLRKPLPLISNTRGRQVIPFDHFINNKLAYLSGGVSSRKDNDKLYSFKEGDLKRLWLHDIEDMLILLIQGKLSNLKIAERVESYQKKLNITNPDTYRSDLIRREQYTAYSCPRGFIHQNKDKKNRLMRLEELYKFSDGTLDDVRTALDDRLKRIRMEYLPKTIWRQSDRERATTMIQAIDKRLKSRRIIRSLERFIDKMDSMHSTVSMYYDYGAHVKGELLDCDEIPKRPTMYLNLWSYKAVGLRYSNPMIQPESEGSTQGYPLVHVEVLRDYTHFYRLSHSELVDIEKVAVRSSADPHRFEGYLKMEVKVPDAS